MQIKFYSAHISQVDRDMKFRLTVCVLAGQTDQNSLNVADGERIQTDKDLIRVD